MPTRPRGPATSQPIDLDTLLNGNPAWDEVVTFWRTEEFHEEGYLVTAIKRYLRTEEQRALLHQEDLSIEGLLNGRYTSQQASLVNKIMSEWNERLGFKAFGW